MLTKKALLLATLETKHEEARCLADCIGDRGIAVETLDVSLMTQGKLLTGAEKMRKIASTIELKSAQLLAQNLNDFGAVIGIGGATGSDVILAIMQRLPLELPKFLITPLPLDPRPFVANNPVTLIPSIVDIAGLNPILRRVFAQAGAMVAGICQSSLKKQHQEFPSIAISALSVTGGAADGLVLACRNLGYEPAVFHANGYGGASLVRFTQEGKFKLHLDITCHEITRMVFAGDHVAMPNRFRAGSSIPRIVMPGGMNFLTLGKLESLSKEQRAGRIFRHSSFVTHISLSHEQMKHAATSLAEHLNTSKAPTQVIVPMGGFAASDRPGGDLEAPELREICLEVLQQKAKAYDIEAIDWHINDKQTVSYIMERVQGYLP